MSPLGSKLAEKELASVLVSLNDMYELTNTFVGRRAIAVNGFARVEVVKRPRMVARTSVCIYVRKYVALD